LRPVARRHDRQRPAGEPRPRSLEKLDHALRLAPRQGRRPGADGDRRLRGLSRKAFLAPARLQSVALLRPQSRQYVVILALPASWQRSLFACQALDAACLDRP
jgi:hypothetical protein